MATNVLSSLMELEGEKSGVCSTPSEVGVAGFRMGVA